MTEQLVSFDPWRGSAEIHGQCVKLTRTELLVLRALAAFGGAWVSREDVARRVWGDPGKAALGRLQTHLRRLRRIVERTGVRIVASGDGSLAVVDRRAP